jgi:preprotein translocase subunit SecE
VANKEEDTAKENQLANAASQSGRGFDASGFLNETKEELSKVVWPSRQQLIGESLAVMFMVTLSATLIYLVDNFFAWAAKQVFG